MVDLDHPNYKISLNKLRRPYDLVTNFKKLNIQYYCYAFYVYDPVTKTDILMNIGMSEGGRIGDRIYRKVGNLPGWGSQKLTGDFGSDMKRVVEAVEKRFANLNLKVDRNNVTLHIWNTSNLSSNTLTSATINAEKKLFEDCKEKYLCIPAGNWQDPNDRNKAGVLTTVFSDLFEEA